MTEAKESKTVQDLIKNINGVLAYQKRHEATSKVFIEAVATGKGVIEAAKADRKNLIAETCLIRRSLQNLETLMTENNCKFVPVPKCLEA